jgi:hypothetical protein
MSDSIFKINLRLAELFDLPKDTVSATLRMRAGKPPVMLVTQFILSDDQLIKGKISKRFFLSVDEDIAQNGG